MGNLLQQLRKLAFPSSKPTKKEIKAAAEASQKHWLENITRDSLFEDLTRRITENGPENHSSRHASFHPCELEAIRKVFDASSEANDSLNFLTEDAFFATLAAGYSPGGYRPRSLPNCKPILTRSLLYFASYPYSPNQTGITHLTWPPFIRSLSFLMCQDTSLFTWCGVSYLGQNGDIVNEFNGRRDRGVETRAEEFFRSIAVPHKNVHHKTGNQNIDADHGTNTVEVLEALWNVQPLPLYWSRAYDNETLRPAAEALSTSRCPLECFYVPRTELLHLVNFLLATVDRAMRANGERRCSLGYRLYRIKRELMLITEEKLSFEDLDTDQGAMRNIHYAFVVLFDVFMPRTEEINKLSTEFPPRGPKGYMRYPPRIIEREA